MVTSEFSSTLIYCINLNGIVVSLSVCWLVVRIKKNCLHVGPEPMGEMPSMGVTLRDPCPHLHEFRKKTRKTLNYLVHKRDRGLNPAPPVYQFKAQNRWATGEDVCWWTKIRTMVIYHTDFGEVPLIRKRDITKRKKN